jgi:PAS domain S-box-containing protein
VATNPHEVREDEDLTVVELKRRLALAEARFQALSESISDFYWETDKDHNLSYVSQGIREALVDTGLLMMGKGLFHTVEANDRIPSGLNELNQLLREENPFRDYPINMQHERIGNITWRASGAPIVDDQGNFAGFRGSAQDISAQVAAERATRLQSLVMKGMRESVFIISADDIIMDVNESVANLLGVPREALIGRNVMDDVWPTLGISEDIMHEATDAVETVGSWTHEVRIQLSPDKAMLVEVSLFVVEGSTKDDFSRVLIARDITAVREVEESRRKAQDELLEAQRIAHMGSFELSIADDKMVCSQEMLRIYGLDQDFPDQSTKKLIAMADPEFRDMLQSRLSAIVEGDRSEWITEYPIYRPNGERVWISAHTVILDFEGDQPVAAHGTVQDITNRKEAELELRHSEDRLRDIISATSDLLWTTNEEHQIVSRSDRFSEITGKDDELNMLSVPWETEDAQRHPDGFLKFRKALENKKPFRGVRTKTSFQDGVDFHWENSASPLFEDDGTFRGFRGAATNITAQVQAEEELRQSEQRLRDVLGATTDFVWETDAQYRMSYVSDQYSNHSAQSATTTLGKQPWLHPESLPYADDWAVVKEAMENQRAYRDVRVRAEYADGQRVHWSTSGRPVYDAMGKFVGYRGASSDITAQVTAETALKQRDVETRAIMSNAPIGLVSADAKGLIKSINPAAVEIFGYLAAEVIEKSVSTLLSDGFVDEDTPSITAFLQNQTPGQAGSGPHRVTGRRRDGTEFPVDLAVTIASDDSNEDLYVISFLDVTEQQETEEKLRQANRMEAVGQLTGGIAHDFNNLMMSMQLNLEFLMEKVEGDEEGEEFANAALSAVTRGSALTSRLLAFSRQQKLSEQAININELFDDLLPLVRRTMPDSMMIDLQIKPDLWPTNADPHQLENAILNLAINARDAMPGSGTLTIESHNHAAGSFHPKLTKELESGDFICIAVTDDGTGMPPEVVEHAFEPFYTTKDIGKGSGLGLSMVYGFVTQSGGKIALGSEEGEGTTIEMFFPRDSSEPPEPETQSISDPSSGHILVVEDNHDVLRVLAKSVRALGYHVDTAISGPDALRLIESRHIRPHILLTDVKMPDGMTGYDLAIAVREKAPDCQILIMSGDPITKLAQAQQGPEGSFYIQKPFTMQDLKEKLSESAQRANELDTR